VVRANTYRASSLSPRAASSSCRDWAGVSGRISWCILRGGVHCIARVTLEDSEAKGLTERPMQDRVQMPHSGGGQSFS
ncbi:MAG: hypothetical protein OTJ97_06370, partial [SAR202 cluster bacterium]|nr:hypothetical protein [SAR202 cluster bacterium]